jgi:histidinol phosphatase-like PHP family hydrolase
MEVNEMRYVLDHDLHIHSGLSTCSNDPLMNGETILAEAKKYNLKQICLTDHFWDETVEGASKWYASQNYEHICMAKPLPQDENIEFLFGCETEMDSDFRVALAPEHYDRFDFVIIPTTHMHMKCCVKPEDFDSIERRTQRWIDRFEALLNMDLPFYKIGVAHLACEYMGFPSRANFLKGFASIPDEEFERLFKKAAEVGIGIELNFAEEDLADAEIIFRPFKIAKKCGCKFYFGSDAHHPESLAKAYERNEKIIDILGLEESDKFYIGK